jgi:hypothetical protein
VLLTWEDPSSAEAYNVYRVEVVEGEETITPVGTVSPVEGELPTRFVDFTASYATMYSYYVTVVREDGEGGFAESGASDRADVTTPEEPAPEASIQFVDLGTAAPPDMLGSSPMTPFGVDGRDLFTNVTTVPSPLGDTLTFDRAVSHRGANSAENGWTTWSHDYTGDVYFLQPSEGPPPATSLTMTLPAGTKAFYFYAEPNVFATFNFTATATDGTIIVSSGEVPIAGEAGARGFGFYGNGTDIASITVETDSEAQGFAVGEFGIADE